jgi:DNA-3-methyladenine glycosylase I
METPKRIRPRGLGDYLEQLTKVVFQPGLNWRVVEAKWDSMRDAFRNFDPEAVSHFRTRDVERLMGDPSVIRNRRKIEATIENARTILDLDREFDGFKRYLRSHPDFDALVKDLRRNFSFVGDVGAKHFLWTVGEKVPPWEGTEPQRRRGKGRG